METIFFGWVELVIPDIEIEVFRQIVRRDMSECVVS